MPTRSSRRINGGRRSRTRRQNGPVEKHARLPEQIERYGLALHRWRVEDASELHVLILANVDHLRGYMHWIAFEPQSLEQRRALVERWSAEWTAGGDVVFGIWREGELVGSAGLHRRIGPDGLEIGYWVDRHHLRQGVATAASRALTDLAFTISSVNRVQIGHDASNLASAGVPARLGYQRLPNRPRITPSGTAGTDTDCRWLVTRDQWPVAPTRSSSPVRG